MTTTFVLVPGHWLGGWAWDRVADPLTELGHGVTAVTLPGLESPSADRGSIGLSHHVDALDEIVASAGPDSVLVAHSGAGKVVTALLDRRPQAVRQVIYVDSGPAADGDREDLPPEVAELPLPSWQELTARGASLEGLGDAQLSEFRSRAVPHPAGVLRDPLRLANPARRAVPSTVLCSSFPSAAVQEMASGGHPMFAELVELTEVSYVDVPTGHWPMWSRPAELATALVEIGQRPPTLSR